MKVIEDWDNGYEFAYYGKDTTEFTFFYPRCNQVRFLEVDISDVRASDGVRVSYDFERDGYVIEQPCANYWFEGDEMIPSGDKREWKEVGFFQSWALEEENNAKEI